MSDTELSEDAFDNDFYDPLDQTDLLDDVSDSDEHSDPLFKAVHDLRAPDFSTRRAASILLARATVNGIEPMLNALVDANESFKLQIQQRLVALGPDFLLDLLPGLAHEDATAREVMAHVLGEMEDSRAIPALIEVLDDPHDDVQRAAAAALQQINTLRALEAVNVWKAKSDPDS